MLAREGGGYKFNVQLIHNKGINILNVDLTSLNRIYNNIFKHGPKGCLYMDLVK